MVISEVLDVFCMSLGQEVTKTKTQVFFSRNVKPAEAKNIGSYFGFFITKRTWEIFRHVDPSFSCQQAKLLRNCGQSGTTIVWVKCNAFVLGGKDYFYSIGYPSNSYLFNIDHEDPV